jgi:hypothetical protein
MTEVKVNGEVKEGFEFPLLKDELATTGRIPGEVMKAGTRVSVLVVTGPDEAIVQTAPTKEYPEKKGEQSAEVILSEHL